MQIVIDRFEGDYAVVELESGRMVDVLTDILPLGVEEGDIIELSINKDKTEERKKEIEKMCEELWE